jgi:hypothetical protein
LQKLEFPAVEDATSRTLFFEPNELVKFTLVGKKNYAGLSSVLSGHEIEWFEKHGVELKIEETDVCSLFRIRTNHY